MNADLNFDDIRPYNDSEVASVLESLLYDQEFLWAIKSLRLAWLPDVLFPLVRPLLRARLRKYTAGIKTVTDFQAKVDSYLDRSMKQTTDRVRYLGRENLVTGQQYLFISNHRDIVLDPALCNAGVYHIGRKTSRIAIGDNLLTKPFAEYLMRINKSFIVKRALDNGKQWLREMKKLSSYVRNSLTQDEECVWIAQREGRAKDGIDATDPALIKMLMLSKPKTQCFSDAVRELNILPVAVSYEWDPCDLAKARELAAKQAEGEYQKTEHEDIESIASSIQGYKGRVDLKFGEALVGDFDSPEEVAAAVDDQILKMYQIQPSHIAAYKKLYKLDSSYLTEKYSDEELLFAAKELEKRASELNEVEAGILITTYANPVVSRLKLMENGVTR